MLTKDNQQNEKVKNLNKWTKQDIFINILGIVANIGITNNI